MRKLNEGSFKEVYVCRPRAPRGAPAAADLVITTMPFDGALRVNDEAQHTAGQALGEAVVLGAVAALAAPAPPFGEPRGATSAAACFPRVRRMAVVRGAYPAALRRAWDAYEKAGKSENTDPGELPDEQLWLLTATDHGGAALEDFELPNFAAVKSMLAQVRSITHHCLTPVHCTMRSARYFDACVSFMRAREAHATFMHARVQRK